MTYDGSLLDRFVHFKLGYVHIRIRYQSRFLIGAFTLGQSHCNTCPFGVHSIYHSVMTPTNKSDHDALNIYAHLLKVPELGASAILRQ